MAVFTALAAFTKDLQAVGGYLSFTFIAATVLVWFELLRKFPKQSGTGTLFWFENLMSIGILGLAAYLVVGVLLFARDEHQVAAPLTAAFLIPTLWGTVKITDWLWRRRPAGSQPTAGERYGTYIAVVLLAGLIANIAANFAAGPVTAHSTPFSPQQPRRHHLTHRLHHLTRQPGKRRSCKTLGQRQTIRSFWLGFRPKLSRPASRSSSSATRRIRMFWR